MTAPHALSERNRINRNKTASIINQIYKRPARQTPTSIQDAPRVASDQKGEKIARGRPTRGIRFLTGAFHLQCPFVRIGAKLNEFTTFGKVRCFTCQSDRHLRSVRTEDKTRWRSNWLNHDDLNTFLGGDSVRNGFRTEFFAAWLTFVHFGSIVRSIIVKSDGHELCGILNSSLCVT